MLVKCEGIGCAAHVYTHNRLGVEGFKRKKCGHCPHWADVWIEESLKVRPDDSSLFAYSGRLRVSAMHWWATRGSTRVALTEGMIRAALGRLNKLGVDRSHTGYYVGVQILYPEKLDRWVATRGAEPRSDPDAENKLFSDTHNHAV